MKTTLAILFGLITLSLSTIASAVPIGLSFNSNTTGAVYTENGMTITADSAELVRTNGLWYLDCCDPGPETFSLTTGGNFNLLSIFLNHTDSSDPIVWKGYSGAALVATNIITKTIWAPNGELYFFSGMTGVDLVTVSVAGNYTDPSFDCLTYEKVPEPAILAILGLGLIGMGFTRKVKKV